MKTLQIKKILCTSISFWYNRFCPHMHSPNQRHLFIICNTVLMSMTYVCTINRYGHIKYMTKIKLNSEDILIKTYCCFKQNLMGQNSQL